MDYSTLTEIYENTTDHDGIESREFLNDVDYCEVIPDIQKIKTWKFWLSGVMTLLTGSLGLTGNTISLWILCKRSMRNIFNILLITLCFADTIFIISNLAQTPRYILQDLSIFRSFYPVIDTGIQLGLALSVFLTIVITIERHQSVCDPLHYEARIQSRGERRLALMYFIPSLLISILVNIPRIIAKCSIGTSLQTSPSFIRFTVLYQIVHPLTTTGLVPLLLLSILNWRINKKIPRSLFTSSRRRAKDFNLARLCTILVLVFLVLNLPRLLIGMYEVSRIGMILNCYDKGLKYYTPTWQWCMDSVANFLVVINSSINFVIYCLAGSQFRSQLAKSFRVFRFVSAGEANNSNQNGRIISSTQSINRPTTITGQRNSTIIVNGVGSTVIKGCTTPTPQCSPVNVSAAAETSFVISKLYDKVNRRSSLVVPSPTSI